MKRHVPSGVYEIEDNNILSDRDGEQTFEGGDTVFLRLVNMMKEQRWEMLMDRITSGNFITEIAIFSKEYPLTLLHIACTILNVPIGVILAIIKLNPNAVLTEDEDGNLPIHLACAGGLSLQVIKALMIECPKSCLQTNHQDEFPMNYILMNKNLSTNIEPLVSTLISRLPPSCIYNDSMSLLHEMSDGICHEGIIQQVIRMHPRVCHMQNKNGYTLLHVLCHRKKSTSKTIRMVIKCNSLACATPDNDGNLPLHLIDSENNANNIIQMLLNAYPQAIFTPNAYGETVLFIRSITNPHKKIKAIFRYSDLTTVRHLLHTTNNLGRVPVQDFYNEIQHDLTKFICSHQDISSLFLNSKYNQKLKDKITSLFLLTRAYTYGSIDEVNLKRRLLVPHQLSFWTTFPLFIKVLMQQYPHLAEERDCNGDLPLHTIVKGTLNWHTIYQCSICGIAPIVGPFQQNAVVNQICAKCYRPSKPSIVEVEYQSKLYIA